MATTELPMTADELLRRPDDGFRYALMVGKLRQMPLAGIEEGRVTANVAHVLGRHVRTCRLGAAYAAGIGFLLSTEPDTVLAPAAAFVRRERAEMVGDGVGY